MDAVDSAQKQSDLNLKLALQNRNRPAELKATGECHYCNDPVECGQFCDSDCRDDFEKMVSL